MKFAGLFVLLFPMMLWALPKKLTTVIDDQSAQSVGANDPGTDCYSKQQAIQKQIKVCTDFRTLTSCLDEFYPDFKKKFPDCREEGSAACLDACVKGQTYTYCSNFCK